MNVSFFISVKDTAVALRERDTSVGRLKTGDLGDVAQNEGLSWGSTTVTLSI